MARGFGCLLIHLVFLALWGEVGALKTDNGHAPRRLDLC
jgi:hypothetical protein